MATVAPKAKTVVTMKLDGKCASHSRTDVSVRDVKTTIDEPAERGGTNQGWELLVLGGIGVALFLLTSLTVRRNLRSAT